MKLANGRASTSMLARSSAFRYSARSSKRTTVQGYPPDASSPHTTASRLDLPEQQNSPLLASNYPNIDEFTEHGQIVIGYMEPVGAVAIAAEGRETLALLRRRRDEPFRKLLARLDLAIASATIDDVYDVYIDEVNIPKN